MAPHALQARRRRIGLDRNRHAMDPAASSPSDNDRTERVRPQPACGPAPAGTSRPAPAAPRWVCLALFGAALAVHLFFLTRHWHSAALPGREADQVRAALVVRAIGAPEQIPPARATPPASQPSVSPRGWPLYEHAVAFLARTTGWPDVVAARTLSAAAFYLALAAVFVLLGQAGLRRHHRLLTLALLLSGPSYVLFSRAFLPESTVLAFSAWFLVGFVQALRTRKPHWLPLAGACGAIAALTQASTFGAWATPAAAYGLWTLRREWRDGRGFATLLRTVAWCCGALLPPVLLGLWGSRTGPGEIPAALLVSMDGPARNLDFATSPAHHVSIDFWRAIVHGWGRAFMPPLALVACLLGALFVAGRQRRAVIVSFALFLAPQLAAPGAFAQPDGSFYAVGVFLLVAFGLALLGLFERRWSWGLRTALLPVPFVLLWGTYLGPDGFWNRQKDVAPGAIVLARSLRALTAPNSVILVVGTRGNAAIPYYAGRRALLLDTDHENDRARDEALLAALDTEEISALVLVGPSRHDAARRDRLLHLAGLAASPVGTHALGEVYCRRVLEAHTPTAAESQARFPNVAPTPTRYATDAGLEFGGGPGSHRLEAPPDSKLWIPAPPTARTIVWEFGVDLSGDRADQTADGAVFLLIAEAPDGTRRRLLRQVLDPRDRPDDRGPQRLTIAYLPRPGEVLCFETRGRAGRTGLRPYWNLIDVR